MQTEIQTDEKLLAILTTRVPIEVRELINKDARSSGKKRAEWVREAIIQKLGIEEITSSNTSNQIAKNTANTNVFIEILHILTKKKPDGSDRTSRKLH